MSSILRTEAVEKSFTLGDEVIRVLQGVNLNVEKGEIITIMGPSGSGKSTLLHIIGGLEYPDKGKVFIENDDLTKLKDRKLSEIRNKKIGFIFQFHHLLPEFTILENTILPLLINGENFNKVKERGEKILKEIGLLDRKNHKPSEISGGERQRAAVARALATNPAIVLADEPTGNLDIKTEKELLSLLLKLNKKGVTFLIVTHNIEVAKMGNKKYELREGKLVK